MYILDGDKRMMDHAGSVGYWSEMKHGFETVTVESLLVYFYSLIAKVMTNANF